MPNLFVLHPLSKLPIQIPMVCSSLSLLNIKIVLPVFNCISSPGSTVYTIYLLKVLASHRVSLISRYDLYNLLIIWWSVPPSLKLYIRFCYPFCNMCCLFVMFRLYISIYKLSILFVKKIYIFSHFLLYL